MSFAVRRLQKELSEIHKDGLPQGISLVKADDFDEWLLDIRVFGENPLYKGQRFRLKFKFGNNYPIEPPEVTFTTGLERQIPMHPHIYSNGIICLDLLSPSQGWSPVQNVESVCVSIQSMLASNRKNERPEGNDEFVARNTKSPKHINFVYDDPTV